jgi:hypothetical protein
MYRENKEAKASERSENEGGTSVPPHAMNNKGWASLHEINLAVTSLSGKERFDFMDFFSMLAFSFMQRWRKHYRYQQQG